ncbi:uncharacterized protein LOC101891098 [Musca domestica]|uniref:Uncharacterized protein LOC101891098 n=1 Tax=Musca domestica TaxID=7370 RepID=A0A9J7DM25_MUSDO|nr:uncharacterized protein LOC101891098 [Musca domestica]
MAMYYYASKISAIACGTRCRQSVLQKSRGQRDRDKHQQHHRHSQRHKSRHCGQNSCQGSPNCSSSSEGGCGLASGSRTPGDCTTDTDDELDNGVDGGGICIRMHKRNHDNDGYGGGGGSGSGRIYVTITNDPGTTETSVSTLVAMGSGGGGVVNDTAAGGSMDGVRYRRRFSEQLDMYDIELGFQKFEVSSSANTTKNSITGGYGFGYHNMASGNDLVQYDVPRNSYKRSHGDVNFESSVLGSGGIMYINGRIVSGPLESLIDVLVPKNINDLDKEFIFSFLLSSRLYLRPHELLGKLLSSVPDSESLESLVALLAEWTNKFPYDYRDERMMSHVKHIVARCSNTRLEAIVSEILSALLKRLTDLENHEEELRACQTTNTSTAADKSDSNLFSCPTSTQYAQILCRIEKKLAKHIGPEEFVQCSSNVLLDKQKKWDQPSSSGGPPGAQDPKKTCNLETYLDWSARLRLFVCNEILQCSGIHERSKCVELWSGVAQYCLLVGNYNSATAILETLESPAIARLKITWSKLQVTCQQLDCMQRHAEGHGNLWHKQAIVLNENHHYQHQLQQQQQLHQQQKTETHLTSSVLSSSSALSATAAVLGTTIANPAILSTSSSAATTVTALTDTTMTTTTTADVEVDAEAETSSAVLSAVSHDGSTTAPPSSCGSSLIKTPISSNVTTMLGSSPVDVELCGTKKPLTSTATNSTATQLPTASLAFNHHLPCSVSANNLPTSASLATASVTHPKVSNSLSSSSPSSSSAATATATSKATTQPKKPNDWVVIPVFADIVKLALAGREDCLQRLPNGHININAFDRMAAIVGAFTKHMQSVKTTDAPQTTATIGSSSTDNNNRVSGATIAPQVTSAMVSASANNTASTSTASACTASSSSSSSSTPATGGEYEMFCRHMQKITRLSENDLLTDPSSPPCSMKISITPHTSILDRLSNILNGQE